MVNVTCANGLCGVEFAIPEHVQRQGLSRTDRSIFCPNGHSFHYTVSKEEKLRKKLEDANRTIEQLRALNHSHEDDALKYERTIRYWKGIAHRKQRAA